MTKGKIAEDLRASVKKEGKTFRVTLSYVRDDSLSHAGQQLGWAYIETEWDLRLRSDTDDKQIRKLLDEIAARNRSYVRAVKAGVPEVGIIFMLGTKIHTSGKPITEVSSCGGLKTYGTDHRDFWRLLQRMGAVPQDTVYDEVPRGRVVYNTKTKQFHITVDPCILKNKTAVRAIMNELRLPATSTKTETDEHYRCPKCPKEKQAGNDGKRRERPITRSRQ